MAFVDFSGALIDVGAELSITDEAFLTCAFEASDFVGALRVVVTGVCLCCAFIDIHTGFTLFFIARYAGAKEGSADIFAFALRGADIWSQAFIDIFTNDAIPLVAAFTLAFEASD